MIFVSSLKVEILSQQTQLSLQRGVFLQQTSNLVLVSLNPQLLDVLVLFGGRGNGRSLEIVESWLYRSFPRMKYYIELIT